MKKHLLIFLIFLFGLPIYAADRVSGYTMSYFHKKEYDIAASEVKAGNFSYYIFAASKESSNGVCGIILKSDKIQEMTDCLRKIETKFEEWSKTAKDNNVTDFEKDFDIHLPVFDCFFEYGSKWCFDFYKRTKPYFRITSGGQCLVVINIDELTSASNRFMHYRGILFAFESVEEIEDFIKAIDPSHALSKSAETQKKEDLFK